MFKVTCSDATRGPYVINNSTYLCGFCLRETDCLSFLWWIVRLVLSADVSPRKAICSGDRQIIYMTLSRSQQPEVFPPSCSVALQTRYSQSPGKAAAPKSNRTNRCGRRPAGTHWAARGSSWPWWRPGPTRPAPQNAAHSGSTSLTMGTSTGMCISVNMKLCQIPWVYRMCDDSRTRQP